VALPITLRRIPKPKDFVSADRNNFSDADQLRAQISARHAWTQSEPAMHKRAQPGGAATKAMTLVEFDAVAPREVEELGPVIRAAGITTD
jgi:hypothetical protein